MNVYPKHKFIVGILDFKQFHKTLMLNQKEAWFLLQEHQEWLIVSVTWFLKTVVWLFKC